MFRSSILSFLAAGFKRQLLVGCLLAVIVPYSSPAAPQDSKAATNKADNLSAADIAQAQQFGQSLGIAEWLGPLAPVALSPFFGITCLSGMALYGKGWVSADNAFLGEGSPLNNPTIFWVFLILTVITSIPRLTKVSKPFAQAIDQVEAWAGIITMIGLKMLMGGEAPEMAEMAVIQMGIGAWSVDVLLAIAAAINVFVINTVKFFFEVLIWITPIPTVDAIFEFANKSVCAVLMAIYGYSPTIATGINLAMFVAAAFVFSWAYRREVFFRTMLMDAMWAFFSPPKSPVQELVAFPCENFGPFSARTRCSLVRSETGWTLTQSRLLRSNVMIELPDPDYSMELDAGYFTNCLKVTGPVNGTLTFSRKCNNHLPALAECFKAKLNEQDAAALADRAGLKTEMA